MDEAERIRLELGDDAVEVSLHGAQVLGWRSGGRERLYLSPHARHLPGRAIRGGIPIIFPQFSDRGPGPRHGFARLSTWRPEATGATDRLCFLLEDDPATRALWPHAFLARLRVTLGAGRLSVGLDVENRGGTPFSFTAALHSYLAVDDLAGARLHGLEGREATDISSGGRHLAAAAAPLAFDGAQLDRVYAGSTAPLQLEHAAGAVRIEQRGFTDVVVWNPGAALSAAVDDLGDGAYARFVCVEAAQLTTPVALSPGACWSGSQRLQVLG